MPPSWTPQPQVDDMPPNTFFIAPNLTTIQANHQTISTTLAAWRVVARNNTEINEYTCITSRATFHVASAM
jgi:hypothetical protein